VDELAAATAQGGQKRDVEGDGTVRRIPAMPMGWSSCGNQCLPRQIAKHNDSPAPGWRTLVPLTQPIEFRIRWLQRHCPAIWGLLNTRARRCLPLGIAAYLSSPGALAGRANLRAANLTVEEFAGRVGKTRVATAYGRDLSGIGSEDLLRDLLCEISLSADLAAVAEEVALRPQVAGKRCDLRAKIGGHEIWAEVKRYEDRWFMRDNPRLGRALTMRGLRDAKRTAHIPRSEALRRKLNGTDGNDGVPEQLPDNAMGLLFLFHSGSFGRDTEWIAVALFGDAYGLGGLIDARYGLGHDSNGLFLLQRWQRVSACCWVRASHETGRTHLLRVWHNPLALRPVPANVIAALEALGQ